MQVLVKKTGLFVSGCATAAVTALLGLTAPPTAHAEERADVVKDWTDISHRWSREDRRGVCHVSMVNPTMDQANKLRARAWIDCDYPINIEGKENPDDHGEKEAYYWDLIDAVAWIERKDDTDKIGYVRQEKSAGGGATGGDYVDRVDLPVMVSSSTCSPGQYRTRVEANHARRAETEPEGSGREDTNHIMEGPWVNITCK